MPSLLPLVILGLFCPAVFVPRRNKPAAPVLARIRGSW
ncbi:hypothetical protein RR42_m0329 [Cupriavidus basilensis]|uniref:Uncharacterized protein n=1 Tax=Cupriavidus basilensis TaxID=68895 RepID=A0A0C4Y4J9_9BURK|nr:hypothetical protein RR42_m0329 [Cupriavidus basilensis]